MLFNFSNSNSKFRPVSNALATAFMYNASNSPPFQLDTE